ncbi:uncharacterized protein OCT59_020536 [Rhizophagus irregularis]|uniref:uncharacterized protein n=1 Tax=Rhizophagus irregularis TaxID=588596 RepID=UPI0033223C4F|nr:hypothetical protein OCT59_020536 [Rhizophagus irregularis]
MATKRGEKRRIDDNERFSKRSTEGSEAEKRVRISDDSVDGGSLRRCRKFYLKILFILRKAVQTRYRKIFKRRKSGIYAPVQKKSMDYFFRKKNGTTKHTRTFTSVVKDVTYSFFKSTGHKLPSINTQASPSKIQEWKSKAEVKRCYNNLFKKVKDGQPTTYMSLIIDKLRKENKNPSKTQIAYAISICETYLNPNNQNIQMSENDGGDRAADDRAGAADDDVTNDGRPNDGAANDDARQRWYGRRWCGQ